MRAPPYFEADFDGLVIAWLDWLQHNAGRSSRTADAYERHLRRLKTWCEKPPEDPRLRPTVDDVRRITGEDIELFCGLYAHSIGISPRSRRALVAGIRGFFAWLARTGRTDSNLAEQLEYPKVGKPLPRAISLAHAEAILMQPDIETFLGIRDAAMISVLVGCGLRVSGLVSMNQSSLIWGRDEAGRERLSIRVNEKGKKDRIVPVPGESALLIRAYLGHTDLASIERWLPDGDQVLWVTVNNRMVAEHEYHGARRRISIRSIRQQLERYGKRAKVPKDQRHPHAFRHLYGTELAEDDVDTITRQALMGHADPKDSEIYVRMAQRKLTLEVDRANPLAKMKAPLLDNLRAIQRTQAQSQGHSPAFPAPTGAHKPDRRDPAGRKR